jgi:ribonuclease G
MSKELVIASNRHETKVAVLEGDQLVEVYFQRANEYSLAGSIHKGRVTRVLPGMQSAFVDLGLERDTFLYVSDFFEENEDFDPVSAEPAQKAGAGTERAPERGGDRGDRGNDRGDRRGDRGRDRGPRSPDRSQDARPAEVRSAWAPPPAVEAAEESDDTAEPTAALAEPTESVVINPTLARVAPAEGDRQDRDRNNDDRRRRSRRRRTRGRGFPDNKYAQPGGATEQAPPTRAPLEVATREEETETVRPASDLLILPGESLAKYRHGAPTRALEEVEKEPVEEPRVVDFPSLDEDEKLEIISKIEDRLDEIESSEEEHEVLLHGHGAVIHAELAAGPSIASLNIPDIHSVPEPASPAEAKSAEASHASHPETHPLSLAGEAEPDDYDARIASRLHEAIRGDQVEPVEPESLEADGEADVEVSDEERAEALADDLISEGAPSDDSSDESEEGEPGLEVGSESAVAAAQREAVASEPGPQTASVREPGGRSMHRLSRRMRRRRGGNRFGQQAAPAAGSEVVSTVTAAAPALAAVAPEPEARVEVRTERVERPERPERVERTERSERTEQREEKGPSQERVYPSITDLLKAGQEIIVQIAKEPLGQKGARITSHIALPGRYVVFMPSVEHLGVSRKIASDEERLRLKRILQAHRAGSGGFIVRTAGEGHTEEEIAADMNFLHNLWVDIKEKAEKRPAPALLHHDLDLVQRVLRDQVTDEYKAIWADNEEMYESVLRFVQRFQPALVSRVKMYTRNAPIFDAFGITQELEKALRPKVWLKSGGYIVINQTEALVAIDVNTGKYVGKSNRLEDTIVKTNTEAVKEIVRQIRLRDLGGIIVVDFIDMDERKNRQKVMQVLEEAMRADKAPYKILQFNDFGLVAITRKRVKQSLERTLCAPCPYCEGAGYVKSVQTIIGEILIEAQKIARAVDGKDVVLRVHPDVAKVLKSNNNQYLEELEQILGRPVLVVGDAALHHEKFDLA